jgi:ubiquinone/menaquinone biosynthesis C-methylase UbiE
MNQQQVWNNIAKEWRKFREKTLVEVEEFLKKKKGRVLDLGCGSGRNFIKNKNIIFYGVDFSEKMLNFAEKNAKKYNIKTKLFKSEAEKLPFKDNFFDSAIFISTLHCIDTKDKRRKTLTELYRVMKSGAEAMISVWDKKAKKNISLEAKDGFVIWKKNNKKLERYYYFYDKEELRKELKECGFKIIKKELSSEGKHSKKNIVVYAKKP